MLFKLEGKQGEASTKPGRADGEDKQAGAHSCILKEGVGVSNFRDKLASRDTEVSVPFLDSFKLIEVFTMVLVGSVKANF